jgi:DNA-binding CsgD family transcriptional regulator
MSPSLEQRVSEPDFNAQFNRMLALLASQQSFEGITSALHQVNALLGCKGSIVSLCAGSIDEIDDYRFILACDIHFKELYRENKWFQIDPYILYAQTNTAPVLLEQVPAKSPGQKRLLQASREAGYRSGAVIAVHSPVSAARMAVLYIGSDDESYFNPQSLGVAKMYLRAIAAEILEWRLRYKRLQALNNAHIKPDECELLSLARQGYTSSEMAGLLGKTKSSVDQRLYRVMIKLGCRTRSSAAKTAWELGLLS